MPAEPEQRRVLHAAWPTIGGVPMVIMTYLRDQIARGWDVSLACPADDWLADEARAAGARVLDWPARRSPGPSTVGETRRLAALIAAADPELVHLHSAKAGLAGRLALRGRRPTVVQPHAWSFLAADGLTRRATLTWERTATRWTDAFVFVSDSERDTGLENGVRGNSWVVPNGVDAAALTPADAAERAAARARLGLADGPVAVCVGRLIPQKGQLDLLDIWPGVREAVAGAQLVLVGDGADRPVLAARDVPGVLLAGDRSDVPDWLAAANLLVAASRYEGMALAPLEAMARGRAVVATDVGGVRESVPPGAGDIVAPGDVAALARAVVARLADPDGSDAAGLVGRAAVERHHDSARAAAEIVSGYRSLWTRP